MAILQRRRIIWAWHRACMSFFECLLNQSPARKCCVLCSTIQRPRSLIAISRENAATRTGSRRPMPGARGSFATQHGLPGRSTFLRTVANGRKQSRFNPNRKFGFPIVNYFANFDFLSGKMSAATKARSCEVTKGFARKCHPSLSTSIPPGKPDISSTLS